MYMVTNLSTYPLRNSDAQTPIPLLARAFLAISALALNSWDGAGLGNQLGGPGDLVSGL